MRRAILIGVFLVGMLLGGALFPWGPRATRKAQALPPGIQASQNVVVDEKCRLRLTAGGQIRDQLGALVASPPYPPDGSWTPWALAPLMSYGDQSTYTELRVTHGTLQAVTTNGQVWNTGVPAREDRLLTFAFNDLGAMKPPYAGYGEAAVVPAGPGTFNVTYASPFPGPPAVTLTTEGGGIPSFAQVTLSTPAGCTIVTYAFTGGPVPVPMNSADVNVSVSWGDPQ